MEVHMTTNLDFCQAKGPSKAPFVIGSPLGYDGTANG